jgi:hypothetical protein
MKKNSLYVFLTVTLLLLLSACGSNSKIDGTKGVVTPPSSTSGKLTTVLKSVTIDRNSGDISANITVTSNYSSMVVATLNSMDISLGGCPLVAGSVNANPNSIRLDANASSKDVILSGKMADLLCVPTSAQLTGSNAVTQNGATVIEKFVGASLPVSSSQIVISDSTVMTLSVATKQLDINTSGATKNITINVLKGSVGAADKNVKITSISGILGSFSSLVVKSDAAGDAVFNYTAPTPIGDNNFTVEFCLEENTAICDTAKINLIAGVIVKPVDPIDNINYFITFIPNGGVNNLALGTRNNAIATLINKDTNTSIPNDRIKSVTVTSTDLSVLKLTPDGGGTPAASINFGTNRNGVPVLLTADAQNSGLAIVKVIVEYTNLNGVLKTRGQLFSVAVLSAEATAFSINDAGVKYNALTKQFEHKFIVQATDNSGNNVSSTGFINVSAMAGFAKDAAGKDILYGRHSGGISGILSPNNGTGMLELTGAAPFNTTNIKENRAFVAIGGDVETYEANGKWNLNEIISGNTLTFSNEYTGQTHDDLVVAVGYNFRDKFCTSAREESVVVVDSTDGSYLLDATGKAFVTLKYDAYMIGKRVMILVNMTGLNPNTKEVRRTGELHEQTLRFHEFLKGATVSIEGNSTVIFRHFGVITTGTNDTYRLENASFVCDENEGTANVRVISKVSSDPSSCIFNGKPYSGQTYIDYTLTTISGEDGTFTLSKCRPVDKPFF